MRVLIINGPNINLLGLREPALYGRDTYEDLCAYVRDAAAGMGIEASFFQSNHEGALVDAIQAAGGVYDGIVINPAAYTHTSVAILDAALAVSLPTVEVHLTDVSKREAFRQVSYIREACIATISGMGTEGYALALRRLKDAIGGGRDK